jgi:hypothetical protein
MPASQCANFRRGAFSINIQYQGFHSIKAALAEQVENTSVTMQANQLASLLAVLCTLGTLFFSGMGISAKQDFFLLLGNVACLFGNAVFIAAVGVEHPTWQTLFVCLTALSGYALFVMFKKYQRNGCDDDDDDDDEEVGADAEDAELERLLRDEAAKGLPSDPPPSSEVRRRKRNARE